jgi:hypothetical protein
MTSTKNLNRYQPTEYTEVVERQEYGIEVFIGTRDNKFLAIGYEGRKKKSSFHYRFGSRAELDAHVAKFIENNERHAQRKADAKEAKRVALVEAKKNIAIGDIYVASWGYSMTIVDAYQVVGKTAAMVTLREIDMTTTSGDAGFTGEVRPIKDAFLNEKTMKKRIGEYIKIDSSAFARKWDGERSYYFNRMD